MLIIVWDETTMANFVTKSKIGIIVSSLSEISTTLALVVAEEFSMLKG